VHTAYSNTSVEESKHTNCGDQVRLQKVLKVVFVDDDVWVSTYFKMKLSAGYRSFCFMRQVPESPLMCLGLNFLFVLLIVFFLADPPRGKSEGVHLVSFPNQKLFPIT
jgi:hypothetical protein